MSIGIWELVAILAVVFVLFGAGKLPSVMGDMAKGFKAFKEGMKEDAPVAKAKPKKKAVAKK